MGPTSAKLVWNLVTENEDGTTYTDSRSYVILRSQARGTNYAQVAEVSQCSTSYTDNAITTGQTYYWTVIAKNSWDMLSLISEEVDNKGNLVIMLPGETQTYVMLPRNTVMLLDSADSKAIGITATRTGILPPTAGGLGAIVGIFDFIPYRISDGAQVGFNASPETLVIALHYAAPGGLLENTGISLADAAKYISIAYWNGIQWTRINGTVDAANQNITAIVTHLSRFAITATDVTSFRVLAAEPNPFTPLNPPYDKVTVSFANPNKYEVIFSIYDLTGTLFFTKTYTAGEIKIEWDGKDRNGNVGEDGIYIYQLQCGTQSYTGTMILAK